MTEVLFGISAAFVGYVIYVLVDEQRIAQSPHLIYEIPEGKTKTTRIKATAPTPSKPPRSRQSKPKTSVKNNVPEQVGLAAGRVYRFLDKHGSLPVAKLVLNLKEDNKIIQRSIGWLAQKGKIILATVNRVEMISLSNSQ